MKTIGVVLKEARLAQKIPLEKLEFQTKIKKTFLRAIEDERWNDLPTYSVTSGFVRNIAESLGVSKQFALALLRRDYPPKKLKVTPNPDIENKVIWSPRLTFVFGMGLFLFAVIGYLVFQYMRFIRPPKLEVYKPKEEEVLLTKKVQVEGKTDTDAKLLINNQPVLLDQEGNFFIEIEIAENTTELTIKAESRSGKATVIVRKIKLDL